MIDAGTKLFDEGFNARRRLVALDLDDGLEKPHSGPAAALSVDDRELPKPVQRSWRSWYYIAAAVATVGLAFYWIMR